MYQTLIIIGGIIGLIVTGAAIYTVWSVMEQRRLLLSELTNKQNDQNMESRGVLRSWTAMDYAAIAVFTIGMMLIIADLFAVIRDRDSYPYYHYGYLFAAFIFMLVGMMFMVVRLGVILRSPTRKAEPTLLNDNEEPAKTDHSHERI